MKEYDMQVLTRTEEDADIAEDIVETVYENRDYDEEQDDATRDTVEQEWSGHDGDRDYLLKSYLKDIDRYPLIRHEEEKDLIKSAQAGDERAREKLINANLRFVISVAKKYNNQGMPLIDLISEGNIGLMKAIDRFDTTTSYHFISYAVWWIRQSILKALSEKTRFIRLPLNRVNELLVIEKALNRCENEGRNCSSTDVAKMTNLNESDVDNIMQVSREILSFDYTVDGSSTIADIVRDVGLTPEEYADNTEFSEMVEDILLTLDEKERKVIMMRFGFGDSEPKSLQEIGKQFGLTKERIRQIEKKAMKRLKHPTRSKRLHVA